MQSWNVESGMFLVSGEQHLMIYAISCRNHKVYELNFSTMKWVKMQNFGDQALFFDFPQSSGFFSIAQLTGGPSSRYIYEIGSGSGLYTSHFLDGRDSMSQLIMLGSMPSASHFNTFWYFPHLSCSVDSLSDDQLGLLLLHLPHTFSIETIIWPRLQVVIYIFCFSSCSWFMTLKVWTFWWFTIIEENYLQWV